MLKIGDFSRLAHVTVKALRHYARLGLLKPVWTDRYTGYRYYSLEQLPRLNRILALKDLGFSLKQIRELLDVDLPPHRLRQLFDQRQQELQQRLMAEQARLERVANRLRQIEQEGYLPEYEITLKSVPILPVASMRAMVPAVVDLPGQCALMRQLVASWAQGAGLRTNGPWVTLYHSREYSERNLDVEVALVLEHSPRVSPSLRSKAIRLGQLPPVETMASTLQSAQETSLEPAYAALFAWVERCGYHVNGPVRELLLDDPDQTRRTDLEIGTPQGNSGGFTEIQIPVQSLMVYRQMYTDNPYRKENEMEPKFVTLPGFTVVGMRYFGKNEKQEISEMWGQFNQRAGEIQHASHEAAYGVCSMVEEAAPGEFEYVAGFKVSDAGQAPDGMVVRTVPAGKYAIFAHVGSLEKLRDTYHYIYQVWVPQSGYELTGGPDFEYYDEDFKDFAPDSRFYIYVPLK